MDVSISYACPSALADGDPEPVKIINPASKRGVLLIADHAGNAVPTAMQELGLDARELERHIAWDPGAAEVAEKLADQWQATAVLSTYSRLIVDPNRPLGDPSSMPAVSDGTRIPANQTMTEEERAQRARLFYWPYHTAINHEVARLRRIGPGPILIAIHSFTPDYGDEERPWHIGVMAAADRRLGDALISRLREHSDIKVGDNQPYSGIEYGYTLKTQAGAQGLANVQIEIRQDLLDGGAAAADWAARLDKALAPLLDDPNILAVQHH